MTSVCTSTGCEPQSKKRKTLLADADRAEQYVTPNQPGRVKLMQISWYTKNRGGQGIMPLHAHDVAFSVVTLGTSKRRYGRVGLVEVPANVVATWLADNRRKSKLNPLLANFDAMSNNKVIVFVDTNAMSNKGQHEAWSTCWHPPFLLPRFNPGRSAQRALGRFIH